MSSRRDEPEEPTSAEPANESEDDERSDDDEEQQTDEAPQSDGDDRVDLEGAIDLEGVIGIMPVDESPDDQMLAGEMPAEAGRRLAVNVMFDDDVEIDDETLERLGEEGFEVQESFDLLAIVTGSVEADRLEAIKKIAGVVAVEENRDLGLLPDPD